VSARDPSDARRDPGGAYARRVWLLALAAVILRFALLLGRGDYLAFDEGWYLLLARSLFTGDGYSLVGFPHTALSPLFPVLAGAVGVLVDSWVWGGRVVAAIASGLVALPAWAVFRRLAPDRTAFVAAALVAVMPSLAPFVVPFWIGADLWVGAEPLLHLFLYSGLALWLRADSNGGPSWPGAGAAFGLAFLARPEAIITWGLLGLAALALAAVSRSPRRLYGAGLMGVAFVLVASPYWLHIHDATGQWSLTGRGVSLPAVSARTGAPTRSRAAGSIERMLWQDDDAYREYLYGLDAGGLRLRSDYWGVQPPPPAVGSQPRSPARARGPAPDPAPPPSSAALYLRSMGQIFPLLLWLFAILGVAAPRGRAVLRRELPVALSLVGTSLGIAFVVAVDPRTQLFLVPLLALYAARGFALAEEVVRTRFPGLGLRPRFAELLLAGTAVVWLLGISARRLQLSLSLGSPHHIVAAQNRAVAEELDALVDNDGPVASWHPAIAVYADRDWRVLPHADLPDIVRYLDDAGADVMVLSAYYPPDLGVEALNTRYLVLPVPDAGGERRSWSLRLTRGDTIRAVGVLEPASGNGEAPE
jgi:hypothetical protein